MKRRGQERRGGRSKERRRERERRVKTDHSRVRGEEDEKSEGTQSGVWRNRGDMTAESFMKAVEQKWVFRSLRCSLCHLQAARERKRGGGESNGGGEEKKCMEKPGGKERRGDETGLGREERTEKQYILRGDKCRSHASLSAGNSAENCGDDHSEIPMPSHMSSPYPIDITNEMSPRHKNNNNTAPLAPYASCLRLLCRYPLAPYASRGPPVSPLSLPSGSPHLSSAVWLPLSLTNWSMTISLHAVECSIRGPPFFQPCFFNQLYASLVSLF